MRNRTDTASLSTTALSFDTRLGRRGHRTLREDSGGLGENTTLKNPAPGENPTGRKPGGWEKRSAKKTLVLSECQSGP